MTELSQMIRWNTGFIRGLAQTVLNRAKVIRGSLSPYVAATPAPVMAAAISTAKTKTKTKTSKTSRTTAPKSKTKAPARKGKRKSPLKQ